MGLPQMLAFCWLPSFRAGFLSSKVFCTSLPQTSPRHGGAVLRIQRRVDLVEEVEGRLAANSPTSKAQETGKSCPRSSVKIKVKSQKSNTQPSKAKTINWPRPVVQAAFRPLFQWKLRDPQQVWQPSLRDPFLSSLSSNFGGERTVFRFMPSSVHRSFPEPREVFRPEDNKLT